MDKPCGERRIAKQALGTCWLYAVLNIFLLSDIGIQIMFWAGMHYKGPIIEGQSCSVFSIFSIFYTWLCTLAHNVETNKETKISLAKNLLRVIGNAKKSGGRIPSFAFTKKNLWGNRGGHSDKGAARFLSDIGFKEYGTNRIGSAGTFALYDGRVSSWYGTSDIDILIQGREQWTNADVRNVMSGNVGKMYSRAEYIVSHSVQNFLRLGMNWIPPVPVNFRGYTIVGASIYIRSANGNNGAHSHHAIVGFICGGVRYIADSNHDGPIVPCNWLNIRELNANLKIISAAYKNKNGVADRNFEFEKYGAIIHVKNTFLSKISGLQPTCQAFLNNFGKFGVVNVSRVPRTSSRNSMKKRTGSGNSSSTRVYTPQEKMRMALLAGRRKEAFNKQRRMPVFGRLGSGSKGVN
jgi:hypothetical protein